MSLTSDANYLYVAAEGMDGSIWSQRFDGTNWSGWVQIPGLTDVSPAIIVFNTYLYFFAKQKASNNIWYGGVPLSTYPSGWYAWALLPGPTPAAVSLAGSGSDVNVAAEGMDGSIWYQTYFYDWSGWFQIPGYTDKTPVTTLGYFGYTMVAKQQDSNNLWYSAI